MWSGQYSVPDEVGRFGAGDRPYVTVRKLPERSWMRESSHATLFTVPFPSGTPEPSTTNVVASIRLSGVVAKLRTGPSLVCPLNDTKPIPSVVAVMRAKESLTVLYGPSAS